MIMRRQDLDDLQSALYCLQAAIEDVDRDLEASQEADEVKAALGWLLQNARPLAEIWIEPRVDLT